MRITITSRIFSPEPAAAAYRLAALARGLADGGDQVTVLTTTVPERLVDGDARRGRVVPGVRVRRAPAIRDSTGQLRGYLPYLSFDAPLFVRLLCSKRSDVVVTEPPPTTGAVVRIAAALRRTPYVYYAADIWSDASESTGAPRPVVGFVRALERFALRGAARVIAVTDGVAARVRELAGHDRIEVVRNGVDTGVFRPEGPRIDGPPTAVYAGTTSEWQGADIFVRAWPKVLESIPEARLVFVGQGTARAELEQLAARLAPSSVEFVDLVPPAEAARRLRSARVALVSLKPGIGYDFAVPTKLFAAAACGTPVLFAGAGASADVVEEGRIGAAVAFDQDEVARALASALSEEPTAADRARRSGWARRAASIDVTGTAAAAHVRAAGSAGAADAAGAAGSAARGGS